MFRRRRPTPEFLAYRRLIETQETIMASIAELTTATSNLTAVVTEALSVLTTPPADVTHLSDADQAVLDTTVAALNEAAANLTAALPASPVQPATSAENPAIDLGTVTADSPADSNPATA